MENVFEVYQSGWNLPLDAKSKIVLMNILWRYNYTDATAAFPSQSRIAQDTGLSQRTVQRALDDLVNQGYLVRRINKNNGRPNEYTPVFTAISGGYVTQT